MIKAKATFDRICIPKQGFAPMLFLEWLADNLTLGNVIIHNDHESNRFFASFQYAKPSDYINLEKYINDNN